MRLCVLGLLLLFLCACSPGPTLVLGRLPDEDVDSDEDAGVIERCSDWHDCESEARPFCSEKLARCVECTRDRQCNEDQYCGSRSGTCISQR